MEKDIQLIPIEDIIPNRFQPRLAFDEGGLTELSESIKQHGIIQPLVLRRLGDKYEIIAGERRYKAATMAGLQKVPAIISNIDDNKSAEVALVENIQRRNLPAIEEAKSYKSLLARGYLPQEQLAEKCNLSPRYISDIENYNGNIPIDTLENIAKYLKIEPYLLVKEQKHPHLPKRVNMK